MATTLALTHNANLRSGWYAVALVGDVGDQPLAVTLLGARFVVWRGAGGELAAAPDRCPHREAPLSAGIVKDGLLSCPYHGWSFDTAGQCVSIPSSADPARVPARSQLATCSVQEAYGLVWLCPSGEPRTAFPLVAEDADPAYRRFNTPMQQWRVSTTRMVDNFMDIAHFAFVHATSIGEGIDPVVPRFDVEPLDECFTGYRYESLIANPEEAHAMNGDDGDTTTVRLSTGFCLPFTVRGTMEFRNGMRQILMIISTPVDERNSAFTFVMWRNDDEPEDEIVAFELKIDNEDRQMLELLDGPLPLESGSLVSVRSDKASEVWRRELVKFMTAEHAPEGPLSDDAVDALNPGTGSPRAYNERS